MANHSEGLPAESYDEIDAFFALYPEFTYRRDQPIHAELFRMFDTLNWQHTDTRRKEAWERFRIAVIKAFNSAFGSDAEDQASWQQICRCLEITPMPSTLRDLREAVSRTHVNLVDLLQCVRTGNRVQIFPTLDDLRDYTVNTHKYFPKDEAYAGGILRYLLREIHNTYKGRRGKRHRKKGKSRGSSTA